MRLRDFHIKRCIVCNKIVWTMIDHSLLYCFDKTEKLAHGKCIELVGLFDNSPNYRGCP